MKKFLLLGAIATLSACGQASDEAPAPVASETVAVQPGMIPPGTYHVDDGSGGSSMVTLDASGTYSDKDSKGVETRGIYSFKDGKGCFVPADGKPEECWELSEPDASGTYKATSADGKTTVTIMPGAAHADMPASATASATPAT